METEPSEFEGKQGDDTGIGGARDLRGPGEPEGAPPWLLPALGGVAALFVLMMFAAAASIGVDPGTPGGGGEGTETASAGTSSSGQSGSRQRDYSRTSGGIGPGFRMYTVPSFGSLRESSDWYQRETEYKAEMGTDGKAEWKLFYLYSHSRCPFRDEAAAVGWLESSMGLGNPVAMNDLAGLYARGKYVYEDKMRAIDLYKRAAEAGMIGARKKAEKLEAEVNGY